MKLSELERNKLNNTFKENRVPFILIAPDRGFHLQHQDLISEYNDSDYLPPQSLIDETKIRIEHLIERSKKEGFTFFDDILGRVDDVTMQSKQLLLKFSQVRYFQFAALNKGLDSPLLDMSQNTRTLRDFLNEDPYDLRSSMLPNPLGVVTSLVLEPENKIVLTIHSNRNFEGSGMTAAAIAGSLSIKQGDVNFAGLPDPFNTIIREANEEIGLSISPSDIKFFGFGRDLLTLKPELIGEIYLDLKEKEFLQIQKDQAKDEWEIERLFIADREEILKFLSMKNWSPPAWACTYLSVMVIN
jgi:8-oxo-dGTP pyrophosphatase MutT (NUDIX family)